MQGHTRGVGVGTYLHICRQTTFILEESATELTVFGRPENISWALKKIKVYKGTSMNESLFFFDGCPTSQLVT